MMKKTIYSAIYKDFYPFHNFGDNLETVYTPDQLTEQDSLLILWGGEDISPGLYGELPNKHTWAKSTMSNRDIIEVRLAKRAKELGIPIIGICRGAQLICALAGGKLVQHVTNHQHGHQIETKDGHYMKTSSLHHQMMIPFSIDHELLAKSKENYSSTYQGENEQQIEIPLEPEIVFFPKWKTLAIQGHPEYMEENTNFVKYCNALVKEYLK